MKYIVLIAVIGILLFQSTGAIPLASVGGPLALVLAFIAAALAVGFHDAWTNKRGVLGWAVNIAVSLAGALVGAQVGVFAMEAMIDVVIKAEGSLARTGGVAMSLALAGGMLATLLGAWGALWIVNRWR